MTGYFLKRLGTGLITLVFASVVVFYLIHLIPGDPARQLLGVRGTEESIKAIRTSLGLDGSLFTQYRIFMTHLLRGDLGTSIRYRTPVLDLILSRLPATGFLILYAMFLSIVVGVPIGIIAALKREKLLDHVARIGVMTLMAIPAFWLGTMLILIVGLEVQLFPVSGYGDSFKEHIVHLFLPALTLSIWMAGLIVRNLRDSVIGVIDSPHVVFARLRGFPSGVVLRRYVLRTSCMSTITIIGVNVSYLLAGSVVVENVFSIPGTGSLLIDAVFARDYAVVQGVTLLYAVIVISVNILADASYPLLDPRVRLP